MLHNIIEFQWKPQIFVYRLFGVRICNNIYLVHVAAEQFLGMYCMFIYMYERRTPIWIGSYWAICYGISDLYLSKILKVMYTK